MNTTPPADPSALPELAIAVLDRGFVYVGGIRVMDGFVVITQARNVHKWGTNRGLGQLAREGPQKDTVLNPSPDVFVPLHALIHLIACVPEKWPLS